VTVRFSSDRDGPLCTDRTPPFSCSARLSLGTHVITATATDPFGAQGSASLTVSVINGLPTATITKPIAPIRVFTSQSVNFQGQGSDPDGTVSFTWQSSLTGLLGTGNNITVQLPLGEHIVTLTVTDSDGATAQDSVAVTVVSGAGQPTAQILAPESGIDIIPDTLTRFVGSASDPEDGVLGGSALRWSSDQDGFLGTGTQIERTLSRASTCEGHKRHIVTLEATDSDGNMGIDQIMVDVHIIC
jgi:hypothetical protein